MEESKKTIRQWLEDLGYTIKYLDGFDYADDQPTAVNVIFKRKDGGLVEYETEWPLIIPLADELRCYAIPVAVNMSHTMYGEDNTIIVFRPRELVDQSINKVEVVVEKLKTNYWVIQDQSKIAEYFKDLKIACLKMREARSLMEDMLLYDRFHDSASAEKARMNYLDDCYYVRDIALEMIKLGHFTVEELDLIATLDDL